MRPVGAEREMSLNIRFAFASNADLADATQEGRFRADLFHRINVVNVDMPPLRTRSEDIVELTALFMQQFAVSLGLPALELDEETLLKLRR